MYSLVICKVAVSGEWVTGFGRLCGVEHFTINTVIKLIVPGEVCQIVDEADGVDPAFSHITLQTGLVAETCLIDTHWSEGTFNEAQRRVEWRLKQVDPGDKIALAEPRASSPA